MNLLLLGFGKTGSLVGDVARQRGHHLRALQSATNPQGAALTAEALREYDVAIDFTNPQAVLENIAACVSAGKDMVIGTTGWYDEMGRVRTLVEKHGTGLVYGSNFSIGVNLFLETARTAAAALRHGYSGQIFERHHVHKKDAPSGTALTLQQTIQQASGSDLEVISFREGEVVGMHEVVLDSAADTIYLCHDAKSRQGFAEGAVRAAEWVRGKRGFYDFRDLWREL